jgi:hypothetical protein
MWIPGKIKISSCILDYEYSKLNIFSQNQAAPAVVYVTRSFALPLSGTMFPISCFFVRYTRPFLSKKRVGDQLVNSWRIWHYP